MKTTRIASLLTALVGIFCQAGLAVLWLTTDVLEEFKSIYAFTTTKDLPLFDFISNYTKLWVLPSAIFVLWWLYGFFSSSVKIWTIYLLAILSFMTFFVMIGLMYSGVISQII